MKLPTYEISQLSLVRVAGADAIKVLNGLCTAKLVELKPGGATEAMFTDDRGRVLAHGMVALEPDQSATWFVGQAFDAVKLVAHIDRFIFREDAQPKDHSAQWRGLLVDVDLAPGGWPAVANSWQVSAEMGIAALGIDSQQCWLIHLPITGPQARLLLMPPTCSVAAEIQGHAVEYRSPEEQEDRRIRNFWPLADRDMNDRTLPQELDRDARAISFTKGCYLGQETVARLDAMGEVQRKLCLVELCGSSEVLPGQSLTRDGKEVGKLNSVSTLSHDGKRFALASMRRGSMAPGSSFMVAGLEVGGDGANSGSVVAHR